METYLDRLKKTTNTIGATTANGAKSNHSTLNPLLDFFSKAGAMREDVSGAVYLFEKAYAFDKTMALRALFYIRDIRGGQGERDVFRACLKTLPSTIAKKMASHVGEYGRWDDLLVLENSVITDLIKAQLEKDKKDMESGESVSLLAKWLPSENASSQESTKRARSIANAFGMKRSEYRKTLSKLRKYIHILESDMSANQWSKIDYEKIPSQAHRKHVKAFYRHDEDRYEKYIEAASQGEKKINTSTLYTYEVFDVIHQSPEAANAMWENLPDYTNGQDALVMADVSGSMSGRPMSVSVSLALYFAERNKGRFNGTFMTFSERPELITVVGDTLEDKLRFIETAHWDMNTNLNSAFQTILDAASRWKHDTR